MQEASFETRTNRECARAARAVGIPPSTTGAGQSAMKALLDARVLQRKLAVLIRARPPASLTRRVKRLVALLTRLRILEAGGAQPPASVRRLIANDEAESTIVAAEARLRACAAATSALPIGPG